MFELQELQVLRASLNVIDIKGSSAQLVANLQVKLENEIILGSAIVVIAGLFTFWREYIKSQKSYGVKND